MKSFRPVALVHVLVGVAAAVVLSACGDDGGGGSGCNISCEPPPVSCEGDVKYTPGPGFVTDSCECDFVRQERRVDCAARNEICQDGQCVCGRECPPQEPFCIGDVRLTPGPGRVTADCTCDYQTGEERLDCATQGKACIEGECAVFDPCDFQECPQLFDECSDEGNVLIEYSGPGTCVAEGTIAFCDYSAVSTSTPCTPLNRICHETHRDVPCDPPVDGCTRDEQDALCREPDPCDAVDCSPPNPRCNDQVAVVFTGDGACDSETLECDYSEVTETTDCTTTDQSCLGGHCVDETCDDITCDPPADSCEGTVARRYSGAGTCIEATVVCDYGAVETVEDCADQTLLCAAGQCVEDPCSVLDCTQPVDACVGATNLLRTYSGDGVCDQGNAVCDFTAVMTETNCEDTAMVCDSGACVTPCSLVDCSEGPAASCAADVLTTYTAPGTCNPADLSCDYPSTETNCALTGETCDAAQAACVAADLCDGVTCTAPAASCAGEVLTTYSGDGACVPADGSCDYSAVTLTTDCAAQPTDFCTGEVLTTYTAGGTCNAGAASCDYATETTEDCGAQPADFCTADVLTTYVSGGTCDAPGHACVPPAGTETDCTSTPPASCSGNILTTYTGGGSCTAGACDYTASAVTQDCDTTSQTCDATSGQCI